MQQVVWWLLWKLFANSMDLWTTSMEINGKYAIEKIWTTHNPLAG
tara:strand:- start:1240 stop:1374 length:135 start_codon:yes stop_codon:yes gene_type:complete